jgi:hypothetical protein
LGLLWKGVKPLDSGKTAAAQNNLGTALRVLGERERGTGRLEEAVAAYRGALEEYTRDRVPLDWAMPPNRSNWRMDAPAPPTGARWHSPNWRRTACGSRRHSATTTG